MNNICKNNKCLVNGLCSVFGCVLHNHLIETEIESVCNKLQQFSEGKNREKQFINILQKKQPPKITKVHINRWYGMRNFGGIDMDKDKVSKKHRRYHKNIHKIKRWQNTPAAKKVKTDTQTKIQKGVHYIVFQNHWCPCVGFIDRSIGSGVLQYQNVYYHTPDEKYVFLVNGELRAFYKNSIAEFIKPFFSQKETKIEKPIPKGIESANDFLKRMEDKKIVERLLADPEPNFHYL